MTAATPTGPAMAVAIAESYVGKIPYVWGTPARATGRTLKRADCSGLAMFVYWHAYHRKLIHSAAIQYTQLRHRPFSEVEPSDLVFFSSGGVIYHVAIYVGNSTIVEAADPQIGVRTRKIDANTQDLVKSVGAHPGPSVAGTSSGKRGVALGSIGPTSGLLADASGAAGSVAGAAGDVAGAVSGIAGGVESFALKAGFAVAGLGLVVLGAYLTTQPTPR